MKATILLGSLLVLTTACSHELAATPGSGATIEQLGPTPRSFGAPIVVSTAARIVVLGGNAYDVFDPASRTWTGAATLPYPVLAAVALPDGRVLAIADERRVLLIDVDAGSAQLQARYPLAATPTLAALPDGRVLGCGGLSGLTKTSGCALWNPSNASWAQTASMSVTRVGHTMTTLLSGEVLVVGGASAGELYGYGDATGVVEIYNPETFEFRRVESLYPRERHTATLMSDGRVFVAGGSRLWFRDDPVYEAPEDYDLSDAILFDPTTETFAALPDMPKPRERHHAALFADGRLALASDFAGDPLLVFEPANNRWVTIPTSREARYLGAVALNDGDVLLLRASSSELLRPR